MLTEEQKKQVVQSWSTVVQHLGLLYASGSIKDVGQSLNLNASVSMLDSLLKDVLTKDCDCPEKKG
jgi:hypothetical protein